MTNLDWSGNARLFLVFMVSALWTARPERAEARGQAEHVVVVVWDGMRPDFVSPQ
jgi:predicted AlkP superfamily pyrophosphatase or phosphodiesterase